MADETHFVLKPVARDQRGEVLAVGGAARRIAGEYDDGAVERALGGEEEGGFDRVAMSLEAREPRRLEHDLGLWRTPQRALSFATASGGTAPGSNACSSTPR